MTRHGRAIAATVILLPLRLFAEATAPTDVPWLAATADAIVVGSVASSSTSKAGGVDISVTVSRSVKGPLAPGSVASVHWAPSQGANPSVILGTFGMWFLAGDASRWTPLPANTNPLSLPEVILPLPAGGLPPEYLYGPEDELLDKVVSELWAAAIAGPSVDVEVAAYGALATISKPEARTAYRHVMARGDTHVSACPMGRFLSEWEGALTTRIARHVDSGTRAPTALAIHLCSVADPRAVPDLARILQSATVGTPAVRCAAHALRNVHSDETLPYLRQMLDDAEPKIRYEGVAGLALRANNYLPGTDMSDGAHRGGGRNGATKRNFPSEPTFLANPTPYLDFWRNWYPNRAPTVSIAGGGASCHPPAPWSPCQLPLTATGADSNGDVVYYQWTACAPPAGSAVCNVSALGPNTVTVDVRDGRGGTASASAVLHGVNQTPTMQWFGWTPNHPLELGEEATLDFVVSDDDTTDSAACELKRVFGNCDLIEWACSGNSGWVSIRSRGGAGGLCYVEVRWRDRWGAGFVERMAADTR